VTTPQFSIAQLDPWRARVLLLLMSLTVGLVALIPGVLEPSVAYAAPPETMPIWRAQIRFVTGNGNLAADTHDDIQVSLNDGNSTWLDYGRDDFEVVDDFTYDLMLTNLRTVGDIRFLTVQKTGTDGWCVDRMTLLINDRPMYDRSFRTPTALCHWVDADDGHQPAFTISGAALRRSEAWRTYTAPARPQRLTRSSIDSRVEAIVGNWIEDHDYKWGHLYGPRYVESTVRDARIIHYDLDMTAINDKWPDGEVDVDFDARFSCSSGRMSVAIINVTIVERRPYGLDAPGSAAWSLVDVLQRGMSAPLTALNSMLGISTILPCPSVLVEANGNLAVPQGSSSDDPPIFV
jgi:hypothetical protein